MGLSGTGCAANFLVKCTAMMFLLADSAVSDRLAVVHAMVDGPDDSQVREDGLEIVIGHLPEKPPWHDGPNLSCAHLARPHKI